MSSMRLPRRLPLCSATRLPARPTWVIGTQRTSKPSASNSLRMISLTRVTPSRFIVPLLMLTRVSSSSMARVFSAAAAVTRRCSAALSLAAADAGCAYKRNSAGAVAASAAAIDLRCMLGVSPEAAYGGRSGRLGGLASPRHCAHPRQIPRNGVAYAPAMGLEVILVRHAIAPERDRARWPDDGERPLSAEGKRKF